MDDDRARLADQLIAAEQDERRRIALFLHDGPVQSLSGIALMLDAVKHAIDSGDLASARRVLDAALERHRETIRSLRDLSFNLEPVVLRDQGFGPAVQALAEQVGLAHQIQVDVDVAAAEELGERAHVVLYQVIRELLDLAVLRGPPTRVAVEVARGARGRFELTIADDAPGERRRRSFQAIEERVRTLNAKVRIDAGADGGTIVRVSLPAYAARG